MHIQQISLTLFSFHGVWEQETHQVAPVDTKYSISPEFMTSVIEILED